MACARALNRVFTVIHWPRRTAEALLLGSVHPARLQGGVVPKAPRPHAALCYTGGGGPRAKFSFHVCSSRRLHGGLSDLAFKGSFSKQHQYVSKSKLTPSLKAPRVPVTPSCPSHGQPPGPPTQSLLAHTDQSPSCIQVRLTCRVPPP